MASASERAAVSEACMPLSASSSSTSRTSPASSSTRRIVSGSPSHARRAGSGLLPSCGRPAGPRGAGTPVGVGMLTARLRDVANQRSL